MRITSVYVEGLFDLFTYTIPMSSDDRITIIHGPNGFGKTVILRMINQILTSKYDDLRSVHFKLLRLVFDDGRSLEVRRESNTDGQAVSPTLTISLLGDSEVSLSGGNEEPFVIKARDRRSITLRHRVIEAIPGLRRMSPHTWIYLPTGEELSYNEILDRFGPNLPAGLRAARHEPGWLEHIRKSIPVRFIETQRLLRLSQRPRVYEERSESLELAVVAYAKELAAIIQAKLGEYAHLSQSLDHTFPTRLVALVPPANLTIDRLRHELSALEDRRSRLVEAGLLDKERELDFHQLQILDERNLNILSVFVEDVKEKLGVFEELSEKLDLFRSSINNRFLYKEMAISSKEGFVFKAPDGHLLNPTHLSSGEQHELVLFYELLFKVTPNSLILIDEPELSLHVVWQQQFLKDLTAITKVGGFDVLIATHSPQIIHDRWDLAVELKAPVR